MGTPMGMMGDLLRGARPIGMSVPIDFSVTALEEAVKANPQAGGFVLNVNPFYQDLAAKIIGYWRRGGNELPIRIEPNARFAQYAWLLTPVDETEPTAYNGEEENSEQETVT